MTNKQLAAENLRLRRVLEDIVAAGTRTTTVRVGDMYDEQGGYEDYETMSDEAQIAWGALAA